MLSLLALLGLLSFDLIASAICMHVIIDVRYLTN